MTRPEDAVERAREALASMRADGAYGESGPSRPEPEFTGRRRMEWALIEPDEQVVVSHRRHGGAITALKRGLLRLLAQYHAELIARQTRFNVQLLLEVERLEERIAALEGELEGERDPGPDAAPPGDADSHP
jgi:hypothetical protein